MHWRIILRALLAAAVCASALLAPAQQSDAAKKSAPTKEGEWTPLFDGKSLKGWEEVPYSARGEAEVKDGQLILGLGESLTGIRREEGVPKMNYEVRLEAMRLDGHDFFCGLTFPVGDACCSLIVGGWGGATVGISSIDGNDASENETTKYISFDSNKWYHVRVRVTPDKIEAWLDDDKVVDVATKGKTISMRPGEIEKNQPFGVATWRTKAALRRIELHRLDAKASEKK